MAKKAEPANEALQLKSLPASRKKAVTKIVGDLGKGIKTAVSDASDAQARAAAAASDKASTAETPAKKAEYEQKAKGYSARSRRLENLGSVVKPGKLTLETSSDNLVNLVEQGARDLAPARDSEGNVRRQWTIDASGVNRNPGMKGKPILGGARMPGEALAGAGFYHRTHKEAVEAMPDAPERAFGATAAGSSRASIESEKASFEEIAKSHTNGSSIYMHPAIYKHLYDNNANPSPSTMGTRVKISDLPAESVAELANPQIRSLVTSHSTGIDFAQVGKASNKANRVKVIKTVRGETPAEDSQNPFTAPKTWSFKQNKMDATPDTQGEYEMRAAHLSDTINGRIHGGQQMFDFYGLRHSNEGILSNEGHTTEDSWQKSAQMKHLVPEEYPDKKALGELNVSGKTAVVGGKKVTVSPNPEVSGQAVMHAYNNAATSEAAKKLETKYGITHTVPGALVQEVGWAVSRRNDYKESSPEFKERAATIMHDAATEQRQQAHKDRMTARATASKTGLTPKQDGMLF